jgi:N utilization substance protein B
MVVIKNRDARRTSVARLAATQGLYAMEIADAMLDDVLFDFLADKRKDGYLDTGEEDQKYELVTPDKKKFKQIIKGVSTNKKQIDEILISALSEGHALDNLDVLLRSVLRAATFEMFFLSSIPVGVIINEYVDLAHAFYSENEPSLVNGVLDRIAKIVR